MSKITIKRQFSNIKTTFINVPTEHNEIYGYTFTPETIRKLEEFERLIISDLEGSNINIEVDFEKPYHAIGYDWIIPKYKCVKCGKIYEVADMREIIISDKEEWICKECYKNEVE